MVSVIQAANNAIRSCIIASPGKKLCVSDLSNIEGRVLAWLAKEDWKIRAFRDFDTFLFDDFGKNVFDTEGKPKRKGPDIYKMAYAKSFNLDPLEVNDDQRQKGKVQELALGYEGGVGAFVTFSLTYNIDLDEMAEEAYPTLPSNLRKEAEEFLQWCIKTHRSTLGLSNKVFVTCDALKRAWRYAHPNVCALWKEAGTAVIKATLNPGETFRVRRVVMRRDGNWLKIKLPSGRLMCYPSPQVHDHGGRPVFSYMGINQYNKKWSRIHTYGGKLIENWTQGAARDVIAHALFRTEAAGYETVLTVHDEIISETPNTLEFSSDELSRLLAAGESWCPDLPLAAAGFEGLRYRKG